MARTAKIGRRIILKGIAKIDPTAIYTFKERIKSGNFKKAFGLKKGISSVKQAIAPNGMALFTVGEVMAFLGISRTSVMEAIRKGGVDPYVFYAEKVGNQYRFSENHIKQLLDFYRQSPLPKVKSR